MKRQTWAKLSALGLVLTTPLVAFAQGAGTEVSGTINDPT